MDENPSMPYPQCGRSIKNLLSKNNDAPSITKYGFLVRGNVCPARAPRTTFLLTIPTSPQIYPLMEKPPKIDHVALHTFTTKHVA